MSFICGYSGNQEDDLEDLCILPQRKTTTTRRGNKDSKNPYSNRGLDKFEALLADLYGKRQMIYRKKGSEDVSLVRFVYSNSNGVRPIVVKIKHHKKQDKDHNDHKLQNIKTHVVSLMDSGNSSGNSNNPREVMLLAKPLIDCKKSVTFDELRRKLGGRWRPWYSLPLFMILILVFLVFFTRSFAIFCTCIGWYIVPTINKTCEIPKQVKKAEYSRKLSEKMVK